MIQNWTFFFMYQEVRRHRGLGGRGFTFDIESNLSSKSELSSVIVLYFRGLESPLPCLTIHLLSPRPLSEQGRGATIAINSAQLRSPWSFLSKTCLLLSSLPLEKDFWENQGTKIASLWSSISPQENPLTSLNGRANVTCLLTFWVLFQL